jgi:hypothetical protein
VNRRLVAASTTKSPPSLAWTVALSLSSSMG